MSAMISLMVQGNFLNIHPEWIMYQQNVHPSYLQIT